LFRIYVYGEVGDIHILECRQFYSFGAIGNQSYSRRKKPDADETADQGIDLILSKNRTENEKQPQLDLFIISSRHDIPNDLDIAVKVSVVRRRHPFVSAGP
jgi:hypothetical protein